VTAPVTPDGMPGFNIFAQTGGPISGSSGKPLMASSVKHGFTPFDHSWNGSRNEAEQDISSYGSDR
jgi:hypothetical protein